MPLVEVGQLAASARDQDVPDSLVLLDFFVLAEMFDRVEQLLDDRRPTCEVQGDLVSQGDTFEVRLDCLLLLEPTKAGELDLLLGGLANVVYLYRRTAKVESLNDVQVAIIAVLGEVAIDTVQHQICLSGVEVDLELCPVW